MPERPNLRLVARTSPLSAPGDDRPISREEAELVAALRALVEREGTPALLRRATFRVI